MSKERKTTANKGFSLVELIIVVAIMAILGTVLAPQYLKYVEKTRLQKDNTAIGEIANAVKIALTDENINQKTFESSNTYTLTITDGDASATKTKKITFSTDDDDLLEKELASVLGASYETTSNTYRDSAKDIILTITATNGTVKIEANGWIEVAGGKDTTDTNDKEF